MAPGIDANNLLSPKDHQFVVNELLSYVQFYRNRFPSDNIKKVLLNFYISDEISQAKDVLWNFCGAHLGDKVGRRATQSRSQQDAEVTDILNAFKKLDEGNIDFLPFVPLKLDRIPRYDPEETYIFSLITRVAVIEQTLSLVTNDIAVAKNEIQALKSHQSPISTCSNIPYSNIVALPPIAPSSKVSKVSQTTVDTHSSKRPMMPTHTVATNIERDTDDGYQVVHHKRRRKSPIIGTKKHDQFHGSRPTVDIFLYRIPKIYSTDQVLDIAQDDVEVLKLSRISHDDAVSNSYKLTIYADDEEKVMQPSYWPEFVACRRFIPPKQRRSNNTQPKELI